MEKQVNRTLEYGNIPFGPYVMRYTLYILYSTLFCFLSAATAILVSPYSTGSGIPEMKSIHAKKDRFEKIKLLNGSIWNKEELLSKMYDDSFYYGELGKYALSSSSIKNLIDSPKSYARSFKLFTKQRS